jgi:LmbE family N-acetylglucosaminyl deacetylase
MSIKIVMKSMSNKRLLIAYAHPDDESFGNGGLIAKYVAEGVDVYLICATDGDMGTVPEDMRDQYDTVRELRLAELDCASKTLGLKQVFTFGYKDSGMMGDASNEDPSCLWYAHQHDHDTVVKRVADVIRQIQPQVVLTFNRYGGYGHPDHIAIMRATEDAFNLAGDASYASDLPPYQPQKLYYSALPAFLIRMGVWFLRLRGKDPRRMGVNQDLDFQAVVDHLEPVHTMVNIADYLSAWDEASACHKSQGGGRVTNFPNWLRRLFASKQGFTRVHPQPSHQRVDERDLFMGVMPAPIQVSASADVESTS